MFVRKCLCFLAYQIILCYKKVLWYILVFSSFMQLQYMFFLILKYITIVNFMPSVYVDNLSITINYTIIMKPYPEYY